MLLSAALLISGSLLAQASAPSPSPSPPARSSAEAVTELEQRFTAALLRRDDAVVGDLLADDLVQVTAVPGEARGPRP